MSNRIELYKSGMFCRSRLRVWCICGFLLSLYATYVEFKLIFNKDYKALCDLSPKLSCTAVFSSSYGKSFGFLDILIPDAFSIWNPPNGLFGLVYYGCLYATTFKHHPRLHLYQMIFCILSNLMSLYLAYLLYILNNICVVCISIYVVNILCLFELLRKKDLLKANQFGGSQNIKEPQILGQQQNIKND